MPDDAAAIAEVAATGWRETYRGIMPAGHIERFLAGAYSEQSVRRRILAADRFDVAVVEAAGGEPPIVGFASWARREREAELVATYLLPAWQRRGIGSALHARAVEGYRGQVDRLVLHVVRDNVGARAFYAAMGYGNDQPTTFELFGTAIPELKLELRLDARSPDRRAGPSAVGPRLG